MLLIANTFKNDKDIDLNISDIKNKPIKETYHVFHGIKQNIYHTESLRNLLVFLLKLKLLYILI